MRLVLDTNVVLSALLWEGSPKALLLLARDESVSLITSVPLIDELNGILARRKFEKKVADSLLSVDRIVALYVDQVSLVRPVYVPRLAPDPNDDVVIGTAIAAKADFIVTGDHGLLTVKQFDGGQIISVVDALRILTSCLNG
jgi:putative PIN family toxin of toxin-antitoxin system